MLMAQSPAARMIGDGYSPSKTELIKASNAVTESAITIPSGFKLRN